MDDKIYKLVMIRRKTRSYYDLSQEDRKKLLQQIEQIRTEAGAKLASPIYDCTWSNERMREFYIVEYPNANAVFEEMACLEKIPYSRYFQATYLLGKPEDWADLPFTPRQPVAKLVLISDNEDAYNRLPGEAQGRIWDQVFKNITQFGTHTERYWYNCLASSGIYSGFGIMEAPDIQAIIGEAALNEEIELFSFLHSDIILGVKVGEI